MEEEEEEEEEEEKEEEEMEEEKGEGLEDCLRESASQKGRVLVGC